MAVTRFRLRRDPAAEWTAANPVLLSGEPGYETDSKRMKVGDGATAWRDLPYVAPSETELSATTTGIAKTETAAPNHAARTIENALRAIIKAGQPVADLYDPAAFTISAGTGTLSIANGLMTLTSTGSTNVFVKRLTSLNMTKDSFLSFEMQRDSNLDILEVSLSVGSDAGTKAWKDQKSVAKIEPNRWYQYTLPMAEAYSVGAATEAELSNVMALRIGAKPLTGTNTTLQVRNVRVHTNPVPRGVHFQFDDGFDDTYKVAYPVLKANGYTGGVAIEHNEVGRTTGDRATLAQLKEMYADGWSFYGHHTAQITQLSDAEAEQVFKDSKAYFKAQGFTRGAAHWVWPGGARDAAKETIALRYWQTVRKVNSFHNIASPFVYDRLDSPHFYVQINTPLDTAKARVDWVVARGGVVVFVFHRLVDVKERQEDWTPADFTALVQYAREKGLTDTNFDALYGATGPV